MKKGRIEITPMLIIASITLFLSISGSFGLGLVTWGATKTKVETLQTEQATIRDEIRKIPSIQTDLIWIKEQLKEIAKHLGAPKTKE